MTNPDIGKLNPTVKAAWLVALRSGQYQQGKSFLRSSSDAGERFCCLGVLCEVALQQGVLTPDQVAKDEYEGNVIKYDEQISFPPDVVRDWAYEVPPVDGNDWTVRQEGGDDGGDYLVGLSSLNDNGEFFFSIASRIEDSL